MRETRTEMQTDETQGTEGGQRGRETCRGEHTRVRERRGDETLGGKHGLKETRHTEASKHRHDWGNIRHICDTNQNSNLKQRNKNPTVDKWFLLFDNENIFLAFL